MIEFPDDKLAQIKQEIDKSLSQGAHPIAAFDADGTLWDTDIGEAFFEYEIQKTLTSTLPKDPWKHYEKLQSQNTQNAYRWLAEINEGQSIETVRDWAAQCIRELSPLPLFPKIKELIGFLHSLEVEVYVVTASIKWSVEPAAKQCFGIPKSHVLGVQTKIENGLVTSKPEGPLTWREGKATAILEKTGGKAPLLCCGNTTGDRHLLDLATHIKIVNAAVGKDHPIRKTEDEIVKVASEKGWHFHRYRP